MFRNLTRTALVATLLATTLPAFAWAETKIKDIEVTADVTAVKNPKAGEVWAKLPDDLKAAIASRLGPLISEDGDKLQVAIDSVALANTFQQATGIADAKLSGNVAIVKESDNTNLKNYTLTISFDQAGTFFPAGTDMSTVTTDSKIYYDAMVAAFADAVVRDLQ